MPRCNSTCLIKKNVRYSGQYLHRSRLPDQDMPPCCLAYHHRKGSRSSQTQCARAGNNQHRNGTTHPPTPRIKRVSQEKPKKQCQEGQPHNNRDKNSRYTIGNTANRRLIGLRMTHCFYNRSQDGISPHRSSLHRKSSLAIEGPCKDGATHHLFHGEGFSTDQLLIDGGCALEQYTIHRDSFSGSHTDTISYL